MQRNSDARRQALREARLGRGGTSAQDSARDSQPDIKPQGHVPEDDAEYDEPRERAARSGRARDRAQAGAQGRAGGGRGVGPVRNDGLLHDPEGHSSTRARRSGTPGTAASTRTRRSPCTGWRRRWGSRPSPLPWLVLGGGAAGLASAIALAWYTQYYDYPLIISGKPSFSYQAFIPIFFELTVLFAALRASSGSSRSGACPPCSTPP